MPNPIEVFFGTRMVSLLKRQPGAIARIAERAKPLLMAALHPDRNPDAGSGAAAEVSEAYEILSTASPDQLEAWVAEFISSSQNVTAKQKARDSQRVIAELKRKADAGAVKLKEKDDALIRTRELVELWFMANVQFAHRAPGVPPGYLFPEGSIPKNLLQGYRVIVKYSEDSYRAYEFDTTGRIRLIIRAETIDAARLDASACYPRKNGTTYLRPDGVTGVDDRGPYEYFVGSANRLPAEMTILQGIREGRIRPHAQLGMEPIFVGAYSFASLRTERLPYSRGGVIVEISPTWVSKEEKLKKPVTQSVGIQTRLNALKRFQTELFKRWRLVGLIEDTDEAYAEYKKRELKKKFGK